AAGIALAARASAKLIIDAARLVALGSHDMQTAQPNHFIVLPIGLGLELAVHLVPLVAAHAIELLVVAEVIEVFIGHKLRLVFGQPFRDLALQRLVLGHELGVSAEQNVGTAAGHVGGHSDRSLAACLGDDSSFPLVILGVQHLMLHAHLL